MTDNTEALQYADLIDRQHDGVVAATIIRELVAENEALRADAERYRWLKENCVLGIKQNGVGWSLSTRKCAAPDGMHTVDAAIDAAMKEQK